MLRRHIFSILLPASTLGCAILSDNGTRLAFAIERASRQLLESDNSEIILEYRPKTDLKQNYEVRMLRSLRTEAPYGGYITVSGDDGGGTSYQGRFVYIPRPLHIVKHDESTLITLRKVQGRIDIVDLQ